MKVSLRIKILTVLGCFIVIIAILGTFSWYQLAVIRQEVTELSDQVYKAYQDSEDLKQYVNICKNWAVRYTLETDPDQLETWKKNYETNMAESIATYHKLKTYSNERLQGLLGEVNQSLDAFSKSVNQVMGRHEDRLAQFQFKKDLTHEYQSIFRQIQSELNLLRYRQREAGDLLLRLLLKIEGAFTTPLLSSLEVKTEDELQSLLSQRKKVFELTMLEFDTVIKETFPKLSDPDSKKFLRKINTLGARLKELVLSKGQLYDMYEADIKNIIFVWNSIDSLNSSFDKVSESAGTLAALVQKSLHDSISMLQRFRKESIFSFLMIAVISLLFLVGVWVFVSKNILYPLKNLEITARKIEEGDFEIRVPVPKMQDELSSFIIIFNTMVDKLSRSRRQLEIASTDLVRAYKSLKEEVQNPALFTVLVYELKSILTILEQGIENLKISKLSDSQRTEIHKVLHRTLRRLAHQIDHRLTLMKINDEKEGTKKVV